MSTHSSFGGRHRAGAPFFFFGEDLQNSPGVGSQIHGDFWTASMYVHVKKVIYLPQFCFLVDKSSLHNEGYYYNLCSSCICHTWIVLVGRKQFHCFMPEKEM